MDALLLHSTEILKASMKSFDFDLALAQGQTPKKVEWLKKNQGNKITVEEFIAAMQQIKKEAGRTGSGWQPSTLRWKYNNLKEKFGFFK